MSYRTCEAVSKANAAGHRQTEAENIQTLAPEVTA